MAPVPQFAPVPVGTGRRTPTLVIALLLGVAGLLAALGLLAYQSPGGGPPASGITRAPAPAGPAAAPALSAPEIVTGPSILPRRNVTRPGAAPAGDAPDGPPAAIASGGVPVSADPQAVIARVKASVVIILARLPQGLASGTGFVVGPHEIGTCAHVVADAASIMVGTPDGKAHDATVQAIDPAADVAILSCTDSLPPPLRIGQDSKVREGDEIAVTGYPEVFGLTAMGFQPEASTTRGSVSARRDRDTENGTVQEIQIDAPVNHGNSGGPVYRVTDGAVIGLAAATVSRAQGLNFASPIDALRRLMNQGPGDAP